MSGGKGGHKGQIEGTGQHPEWIWSRGKQVFGKVRLLERGNKRWRQSSGGLAVLLCCTDPMRLLVLRARDWPERPYKPEHLWAEGACGLLPFITWELSSFTAETVAFYWPSSSFGIIGHDLEMLAQAVLELKYSG